MATKQTQICNVADVKDVKGQWLQSYYTEPLNQGHTRAGMLWKGIRKRCKVGGPHQTTMPSYVGTTNGFKNFQDFAEWATKQYGYLHKDTSGMYWQLDKDLKVYGNKEYNPESCIFVPQRVNSLLIASNGSRGDYPVGVTRRKQTEKFLASCSSGQGVQKYLGSFNCPYLAHRAWQQHKIEIIESFITNDEEVKSHTELVAALTMQVQRIKDDLFFGRETIQV